LGVFSLVSTLAYAGTTEVVRCSESDLVLLNSYLDEQFVSAWSAGVA